MNEKEKDSWLTDFDWGNEPERKELKKNFRKWTTGEINIQIDKSPFKKGMLVEVNWHKDKKRYPNGKIMKINKVKWDQGKIKCLCEGAYIEVRYLRLTKGVKKRSLF